MKTKPRILFFDIETSPILGYVWGLYDQNIGLNQINTDWTVLSWAAKWQDEDEVMYQDVSKQRNLRNDKAILKNIWKLLDEADIVVTQNGKSFDSKKLNARFIINGFKPPSSYLHYDTLREARKNFGFTSNSLENLSNMLNTKHKKLKHAKFAGFELWKECLKKNLAAWKEMKTYNINDVLTLEDVYNKLHPWSSNSPINLSVFKSETKEDNFLCKCGSTKRTKYGYAFTKISKFQRYKCVSCGNETRGSKNLILKSK